MLIGVGTQWIYVGIVVKLEIEFKDNNNIYNAKISEIQYNYHFQITKPTLKSITPSNYEVKV